MTRERERERERERGREGGSKQGMERGRESKMVGEEERGQSEWKGRERERVCEGIG